MTNKTQMVLDGTLTFSKPTTQDGAPMWELVNKSTLDLNSPYKYIMMCEFFSETCVVAKEDGKVVGFVTAFIPPEKNNVLFIWQIGVDASQRGKGIASKMLQQLLERNVCKKVKYVEATVTPTNIASQSLFFRLARELNTECTVNECFSEELFPGEKGNHEAEDTYRVGPITK
ncbi:diaminobutyrate acetyltransferase [Evansella cellulosilytica]|uniref:L-2,4-diaminobutyric acid acetyltransferase n=1 Tax=Evansella cellulosilytica (strain ATCC 21833 / DSM 2522 / FERM P-1141 / JCM 9156 / N-4) TaxID=649639 RepID=E6U0E1_EVAC2|nr:diaminobutyrate acetyltransferase [Evansella cellulosilytica]ADU30257.1 L-2,4-diaminobutyric acid acetyltransferase [Evansella cellulosilytica DSM 2522]